MNSKYIDSAKEVIAIESMAIAQLSEKLNGDFDLAISKILKTKGKVIVCGMGKSGIIGKKIAATFSSTGTPSFFMHPGEAYHGDLGMVTEYDLFLAISNSGETDEVIKLLPFLKENKNFLVSFTGDPSSTLAKSSGAHISIHVAQEACPLQLAPTTSTTAALVMGDALAVTLMGARAFKAENFARFHPGGSLGRRLLRKVRDEMIHKNLPFIPDNAPILDILESMSSAALGIAIVTISRKKYGIITDGDLRRAIQVCGENIFLKTAKDIQNGDPEIVNQELRVEDALAIMDRKKINTLLVENEGEVVGVFKK